MRNIDIVDKLKTKVEDQGEGKEKKDFSSKEAVSTEMFDTTPYFKGEHTRVAAFIGGEALQGIKRDIVNLPNTVAEIVRVGASLLISATAVLFLVDLPLNWLFSQLVNLTLLNLLVGPWGWAALAVITLWGAKGIYKQLPG